MFFMTLRPRKYFLWKLILPLLLLSGCYNDNEEDVYQYFNLNGTGCDTVLVVYSKQMRTLFGSKCNSCHTTNAICNFDTYDHAYNYSKDNAEKLYTTVTGGLHQGVTLTDCEKKMLKKWTANPAP
jgi:hypothetical protein